MFLLPRSVDNYSFRGERSFLGKKGKKFEIFEASGLFGSMRNWKKRDWKREVNDTARRSILNLFRSLNRTRTSWFPGVNKFSSASHSPRNCIHPLYTETEITVPDIKIYTSLLRLEINGPPCLFPPLPVSCNLCKYFHT